MALWDLANADCIVVMGSNMAENHPVAFRFVTEAQQRGATVVHVDPRFTRTSALADIHAPIRSGTDIAFLGGIIRYILANDLWFREFALAFTNIATIIEDNYRDAEDNGGVFSGFDGRTPATLRTVGSTRARSCRHRWRSIVLQRRHRQGSCADAGTRRRTIPRCSIRTVSTRSCAATMSATRRRWWSA